MNSYERIKAFALLGPVALLFGTGFLIAVSSGSTRADGGVCPRRVARSVAGVLAKVVVYVACFFCLQEMMGYRG